jgi:hypothetical protein
MSGLRPSKRTIGELLRLRCCTRSRSAPGMRSPSGDRCLKRDAAQGRIHRGTFSLVLRCTGLGWRITRDHTSG